MSGETTLQARLTAFLQATQAVTTSLELEQVLQAIIREAARVSGTPVVRLFLLDEDGRVLRRRVGVGLPPEAERDLTIPVGESFSGQVAATGAPVGVADCRKDPRLRFPEHATKYGLVSYLGIPVRAHDRLFGVLVFNTAAPREYPADEVAYLSAFAQQAGLSIHNARIHEGAMRRARQLATLNELTRTMTTVLDPQGVAKEILAAIQVLIPGAAGCLWGQAGAPDEFRMVANLGLREPEGGEVRVHRPQEGLFGAAIATRRPAISQDVGRDPRFIDKDWAAAEGLVSCIVLPLVHGEHVHGVLAIYTRAPHAFAEEEVDLFRSFATQAAIAIENAQLFQREQTRRRQIEAVRVVSEEIARELDLSRVLALIIRRSIELVGADSGIVRLWEESQGLLIPHSHVGMAPSRLFHLRPGEGVAGMVAQRREGMIVNDFQTAAAVPPHIRQGSVVCATVAQPLLYRDRLVGVISIFRETPTRPFSQEDQEVLGLFATQAAVAIENARLFAATQQRAAELAILRNVGEVIASRLELAAVLEAVVAGAMRLLGTQHTQIILWDGGSQRLRLGAALGTEAERVRHDTFELGRGANGTVALTRQPLILNEYQSTPHAHADYPDVLATITVPVLYGDRLLGVLHSHTTEPARKFTPDDLRLFQMLAAQAAIAIENARLYDAVQRHAAELEDRVNQRTAELEEALRVKAQFLANMSHELRTPLNVVIGFSELLRDGTAGPLTAKQAGYLSKIHTGGKRLLELVTHLLEIAETDTGPASFRLERLVLRECMDEVLGPLAGIVEAKSLALERALDPNLPVVVADRRKLAQILHHLVTNGIRFTPIGGRVTVSTRRISGPKGEEAELAVQDSGIGIRPKDLERIFLPFEQVDGSDTRQYGGAGLGLALVRRLVELHGGCVWAESEGEGRGARFIVRLPLLPAPPPPRVLVVDDDAAVREALCTALTAASYGVEGAGTGVEALERLAAGPPNLLVLDIGLPDMDGRDLLKRLRADARTRDLPTLVLSGMDSIQPDEVLTLGADEFLTKPVSPQVLSTTVARLLTRSVAARSEADPSRGSPFEG
jgi:GAF domain-containing protein/ActR/RegA family two-component response regulator